MNPTNAGSAALAQLQWQRLAPEPSQVASACELTEASHPKNAGCMPDRAVGRGALET